MLIKTNVNVVYSNYITVVFFVKGNKFSELKTVKLLHYYISSITLYYLLHVHNNTWYHVTKLSQT